MARSLGFGSNTAYYVALFRLGFPSAPYILLNLACNINSPVHSAKGTPSPINGLWLFVSTWFQYSISLPFRGSFHLSLTVLVHYRSLESISPYGLVPADSDKVTRASPYSGYPIKFIVFRLQDYHLLRFVFPHNSTILWFSYFST